MMPSIASPTHTRPGPASTTNGEASAHRGTLHQPSPDKAVKTSSTSGGHEGAGAGPRIAADTSSTKPGSSSTWATSAASTSKSTLPPEAEYQWIFSKADLQLTPSVLEAGIQPAQERQLRGKGIHLIYRIGDFMRLGQHVLSTACVFFHRFYMRKPLQYGLGRLGHSHYEIGAACIFLACKVEETHRKLPAVIEATMASLDKSPSGLQKWSERTYRADPNTKEYGRWRDIILVSEEVLLEALAFDLIIDHPHEVLVKATYRLGVDKSTARLAWTIINDSMRDPTCVMYEAPVLAAGAFQKACSVLGIDPNSFRAAKPAAAASADVAATAAITNENGGASGADEALDWTAVFDVDEDEATEVCEAIDEDVYGFHGGSATPAAAAATATTSTSASTPAAATPVPAVAGGGAEAAAPRERGERLAD